MQYLFGRYLSAGRLPEYKPGGFASLLVVYFHAHEVHTMCFFHDHRDAGYLKEVVVFHAGIEAEHIGNTGTTSAFYAYPQVGGFCIPL